MSNNPSTSLTEDDILFIEQFKDSCTLHLLVSNSLYTTKDETGATSWNSILLEPDTQKYMERLLSLLRSSKALRRRMSNPETLAYLEVLTTPSTRSKFLCAAANEMFPSIASSL